MHLSTVPGDITSQICTAINNLYPGEALGAQKMCSSWIISVRSRETGESLLRSNLTLNGNEVQLYRTNPYDLKTRVEGERVVFKDLPFWEPSTLISEYLAELPQVGRFSEVHFSKARNHLNNEPTQFLNGDRYVFMKVDQTHPLPDKCVMGGYPCRIWYSSKRVQCKRCSYHGHRDDSPDCPYYIEAPPENFVLFKSGILSNFHPSLVKSVHGEFATSEHYYQWRACTEHLRADLAAKVLLAKTPKEAKKIASEVKVPGSWWEEAKYSVMKDVLIDKIASSKSFRDEILNSGNNILVEALADPYWGCGFPHHIAIKTNPNHFKGSNKLGELLMELRAEMRSDPSMHPFLTPQPDDTQIPGSPVRSRPMLKQGAKGRASSAPSRAKNAKPTSTPLIKDMFQRQSAKRPRMVSPELPGSKPEDDDTSDTDSFLSVAPEDDVVVQSGSAEVTGKISDDACDNR